MMWKQYEGSSSDQQLFESAYSTIRLHRLARKERRTLGSWPSARADERRARGSQLKIRQSMGTARDEFFDLVWRHIHRGGVILSM